MKYSIKITDYGCIETIKINGKKYKKRSKKTKFGCMSLDDNFRDQMAKDGIDKEITDFIYDLYDGYPGLNFMELAEVAQKDKFNKGNENHTTT
mgnify:CR=1 FL=1